MTNVLAIQSVCHGAATRCQGLYVHAWLQTALATPYPILLDFTGVVVERDEFWRAALGSFPPETLDQLKNRWTVRSQAS